MLLQMIIRIRITVDTIQPQEHTDLLDNDNEPMDALDDSEAIFRNYQSQTPMGHLEQGLRLIRQTNDLIVI